MTILQVHKYYWPRDGASKYMLELEDLLLAAGHTVIPFSMQQEKTLDTPFSHYFVTEKELDNPHNVSFGQKVSYVMNMIYSHEAKRKIGQLLDDHEVDIVHLHNIYHHISPSILVEIQKRGIPIVMTLHDFKLLSPNYTMFHHGAIHEEDATGWYLSCIANKCFKDSYAQSAIVTAEMIMHHKIMQYYERYVDHFIAPSKFIKDLFVRFGWPEEQCTHIPHPYNATLTQNTKEGDKRYVGYIGRLSEEKGVDILVQAAAKTLDIQYKIAGTGPQEEQIKQRIQSLGLSNVELTGFITGSDLVEFVQNATLLVVPSVYYENYPLSVLESMAAAKVTIGSNIGGIPEQLPEDLLFTMGDPVDLAQKIQIWYGKTFLERQEKGKELREKVMHENDPGRHVERMVEVYERSLPGFRSPQGLPRSTA